MTDLGTDRTADHELAAELATEAGRLLLGVRDELGFDDARTLKDTGDLRAHEYLMAALAERRPGDAVLSEEGRASVAGKRSAGSSAAPTANTAAGDRLAAPRVWIIDPLDGTREFSEEGRLDWAVHVALWTGDRLAAGAVALPARGITLTTTTPHPPNAPAHTGEGGRTGGVAAAVVPTGLAASGWTAETVGTACAEARELAVPEPAEPGRLRIAVSRTRPPAFLEDLAKRVPVELDLVPIGSAGAKISAVLLGEVDGYVHAGGQYEWDSAAPAAVALAAGATASRLDGSPLVYNRADPWLPDILVCHPGSTSTLLTGIRDLSDIVPNS
ncbi:inositol monophosphatase family protein [Actinomadura harenae]|uniref:inositol-phosphate phosphatase n=1 Tax=Actinomadura harenae TaxID=2483351 RepID=A0A3M2LTV2_9ACTN|nr:inositol monophosphatase family protein [Actinomadura harenae]RMI40310.1 3'(2'),5'-bisphosphate nucleotidase CysQ [Actinomadura harenae]